MGLTTDEMLAIKLNLYKNGVILVEKTDDRLHPELNMNQNKIMRFLKTMKSKNHITEIFVWNHGYFKLTPEGVEHLKEELCALPDELPLTHSTVVTEVHDITDLKEGAEY